MPWLAEVISDLFLKPGFFWSSDRAGFLERLNVPFIGLLFSCLETVVRKHAGGRYNPRRLQEINELAEKGNPIYGLASTLMDYSVS